METPEQKVWRLKEERQVVVSLYSHTVCRSIYMSHFPEEVISTLEHV
jgi:hypothetical protein